MYYPPFDKKSVDAFVKYEAYIKKRLQAMASNFCVDEFYCIPNEISDGNFFYRFVNGSVVIYWHYIIDGVIKTETLSFPIDKIYYDASVDDE